MDWQITGHKKQLELLERALNNGKLSHAYVFAGPDGVGKRTIAKRLAVELLGGSYAENYFHPDFLEIAGETGIKIEQIRELAYKLSLRPYQAKNKVALIDNADQMSNEAANALLKVLEEPKNYTYLILTTCNPYRLPKTILSRCQKITFGPIARTEPVQGEDDTKTEEFYQIYMHADQADKLIAAYDMADLETLEIKKMLEAWSMKLEIELLKNPSKNLARKISRLLQSQKYLDQNANSKLLLTNLMLAN